jgi:hypothetical protein
MGEKEIRSKLEEDLYSKLCNRLPGGIDDNSHYGVGAELTGRTQT